MGVSAALYWRVSLNGATAAPITGGGTDTLVSITNVSTPGVIAHVTVWNKYSKAVLDFNVPLTGKDVAFFSMRGVMNGVLNVNSVNNGSAPGTQIIGLPDPCGINTATNSYEPSVGWGQTQFIRFSHPDAQLIGVGPVTDAQTSIGTYLPDAFGPFRVKVWDSLDESGNITSLKTSGGANILDTDNPACSVGSGDGVYSGDLSGYLTIDVVNYCTNYFPDQSEFYYKDAIATLGWGPTYTPNVLIGDVFYLDTNATGGNISGDPAVAVEFDSRLPFTGTAGAPTTKTFFGKYVAVSSGCPSGSELAGTGCAYSGVPAAFNFAGDGREPLGDHYGFRYYNDGLSVAQLQTWALVWRSDMYKDFTTAGITPNLCDWLKGSSSSPTVAKGASGYGLYDSVHQLTLTVFDSDENPLTAPINGGPSGNQPGQNFYYIFLEASRITIPNVEVWPDAGSVFKGGWIDLALRGPAYTGATLLTGFYNQGWVGVQHSGAGAFVSVGHAASSLNNQFQCQTPAPVFTTPGNTF